jgi:GH15 family glucan-1,4-alpha-glucosidase
LVPAHFGSRSIFAALLDDKKAALQDRRGTGATQLCRGQRAAHPHPAPRASQVTDFMPIEARSLEGKRPNYHQIIRRIATVAGNVRFRLECFPAFDYARETHNVRYYPQGVAFVSPSSAVGLVSPVPLDLQETGVTADFALARGKSATFYLRQTDQGSEANLLIPQEEGSVAFHQTMDFWKSWLSQCRYTDAGARWCSVRRWC